MLIDCGYPDAKVYGKTENEKRRYEADIQDYCYEMDEKVVILMCDEAKEYFVEFDEEKRIQRSEEEIIDYFHGQYLKWYLLLAEAIDSTEGTGTEFRDKVQKSLDELKEKVLKAVKES